LDAGRRHERIQPPEGGDRGLDRRTHALGIIDGPGERQRAPPALLDLCHYRLRLAQVEPVHCYRAALCRQLESRGAADAAGAAGDEGDSALMIHLWCLSRLR
jgi:hypothetical protein